jgi:hypothetical protein
MKRLLIRVLDEFITRSLILTHHDSHYSGLCDVVHTLKSHKIINETEQKTLFDLIYFKLHIKFITYSTGNLITDVKWHINDRGVYIWKPYATKPRIKWLEEQIKKY